jgi:FSR family fosmidomycin resistance protein-like MFS transporter
MSDQGILTVFTIGHLIDDMYVSALPPLIPVLVSTYGLSFAVAGMLVTFFTATSSVAQPFFGYLIDKYRIAWMGAAGLMLVGVFIGLLGLTHNYYAMLIAVLFAGLGPAMFHPHASSTISEIQSTGRGRLMAIFLVGGNLGFAAGPIMVGILTAVMGMKGMLVMALPGLLMGLYIWRCTPVCGLRESREMAPLRLRDFFPASHLLMVAVLRSWLYYSILSFVPSYFVHHGDSILRSTSYLSFMLLAGVAGQLAGGSLSDRFGKKQVTMASLLASAPLLYLFLHTSGALAVAFLLVFGFTVMASFSVTLVMMQEIMSKHVGMASGLMIGFAIGVGGIGVLITGSLADAWGLQTALNLLIILPVAAGILTHFVPSVR